jgi:hypothetical protein
MLRFSTLADQVLATLFEMARDSGTDRTELTARVLDLQHAKLPISIISKLKALHRMMMRASLRELFSRYVERLLRVLDFIYKAGMRRLLPFFRTMWSSPHPAGEKLKKGYDNLTAGLQEMSSFHLEQFEETAISAREKEEFASKPLGTVRRQVGMPVPQMKSVKRIPRIKSAAIL